MAQTSVPWNEGQQPQDGTNETAAKTDFFKSQATVSMAEHQEMEDKRMCERNFGRYHYGAGTVLLDNQDAMRRHFKALAEEVCMMCPDGRERSLALTKLEEGMFWVREALGRR